MKLGIDKQINLVSVLNDDFQRVSSLINELLPDEIYYLAGQSSVGLSFLEPKETISSNLIGILNVLEVCRLISKKINVKNFDKLPAWTIIQNKEIKISSTEIRNQREQLRQKD